MVLRSQMFTAPGTWTNPGTVTRVFVVLMGGGGGGACASPAPNPLGGPGYYGNGGAGGFRTGIVPVSGPQPVVVGAGGTGGSYTAPVPTGQSYFSPGNGGTSSFGSGPTSLSVDGGSSARGNSLPLLSAPPTGGGGATTQGGPGFGTSRYGGTGGTYGKPAVFPGIGGGSVGQTSGGDNFSGRPVGVFFVTMAGTVITAVGGGGGTGTDGGGFGSVLTVNSSIPRNPGLMNGVANTGGGGGADLPGGTGTPGAAGNGGSGFVIVEWDE